MIPIYVLLAVLVFLTLALASELQQKYYRERFAREDALSYPPPLKDLYYDLAGTSLLLQAGVMTVDEVRRYEQAWDELMEAPKHRTLFLPSNTKLTRLV